MNPVTGTNCIDLAFHPRHEMCVGKFMLRVDQICLVGRHPERLGQVRRCRGIHDPRREVPSRDSATDNGGGRQVAQAAPVVLVGRG